MLILTRRRGETLRIGDNIEVTVTAVLGNQVRLGIKAPREIVVDREEIAEAKAAERLEGPKTCRVCNRKDCICREARARVGARP